MCFTGSGAGVCQASHLYRRTILPVLIPRCLDSLCEVKV
jgi:hypothetical protein